jgi:hypothetical protein
VSREIPGQPPDNVPKICGLAKVKILQKTGGGGGLRVLRMLLTSITKHKKYKTVGTLNVKFKNDSPKYA